MIDSRRRWMLLRVVAWGGCVVCGGSRDWNGAMALAVVKVLWRRQSICLGDACGCHVEGGERGLFRLVDRGGGY